MNIQRIRTFSSHYRERFGQAVGKIPLDTGTPCPNRQQGGCIYCRPAGFSPSYLDKTDTCSQQIIRGKSALLKSRFSLYFAYFQQETSTAAPEHQLLSDIDSILEDDNCTGIILSTRPDYLPATLLAQLAARFSTQKRECIIEIGLQTAHDSSLKLLNRNHTFVDFAAAVQRIRDAGRFTVGAHLICGIPGEDEADMLETLQRVCKLGVDALKLHQLQVLKDTPLECMYRRGQVTPFSMQDYLAYLLVALPVIPEHIVIHRLWATSHPDLLVAPRWNVLATHLSRTLLQRMEKEDIRQGMHVPAGI